MNRRNLDSTFGILPSDYSPSFGGPLSEQQNARLVLLRSVCEFVGESVSADAVLDLTRYVETGLRSYEDTPTPAQVDEGTDPVVVDDERVRTAVETVLQGEGYDPTFAAKLATAVVDRFTPTEAQA